MDSVDEAKRSLRAGRKVMGLDREDAGTSSQELLKEIECVK
jgi:hypothetical protein